MKSLRMEDPNDDDGEYHIPGAPCGPITLCGYVDVNARECDHPPTCKHCFETVRYCKRLRITRAALAEKAPE